MDHVTRPLSHGQMGLWIHHQKRPTGSEYNLPVELRIKAPFDIDALRRALQSLIDRHEMLRTAFHQEGGRVVQRIHETASLSFHVVRLQGLEDADFHHSIAAEARSPFDLEHGPVFRAHLFIRSATEEVLLLNFHHIISDGFSIRAFLHEFGRYYQACCGDTDMPGLTTAAPYGDFVAWQERLLAGDDGERMWAYWRSQLVDHEPDLALPTDRPRAALATHNGSVFSVNIQMPLVTRLERLAHKEKVTLATVLLSAFYVLLHRYGDQDNITLYVPRLGRPTGNFSGTFGYFVTMAALRQDLSENSIFLDHLQQVRQLMRCARSHEYFPLSLLLEKLKLPLQLIAIRSRKQFSTSFRRRLVLLATRHATSTSPACLRKSGFARPISGSILIFGSWPAKKVSAYMSYTMRICGILAPSSGWRSTISCCLRRLQMRQRDG